MAEGVFRSLIAQQPYQGLISNVDSCATSDYHSGSSPDQRTMKTLEHHGIVDYKHAARKIRNSDFEKFDYILTMDHQNLQDVKKMKDQIGGKAKVLMFGEFSGGETFEVIKDPYYGGNEGFEIAFEQCTRFSKNFLREKFPET